MSRARTARAPALRYRAARRTDVDTLAELALRAYRVSSIESRREFFTDHPRFTLRDVRVGELDGELVAALVMYPFTAYVRGARVPVTGIGSVAVSPEHRRRGIGEALIRSVLREMRQRGDALTMLYAFRADWYRRFGWSLIESPHLLSLPPGLLPASDESRRVRRLRLPDRRAVEELYERVAEQGHFALARRPEWWLRRLWTYEGDWVVYEGRRRGQIEGYLQYQTDHANGPFKLSITVNEFVAATPAAHQGLWGYLHALRDQVAEVVHVAPGDGLWLEALESAKNLRPGSDIGVVQDTGNVGYGAMLRILEPKAALESLPVSPAARGEVAIEVVDGILPQNSRAWRVTARDGRLLVRAESARANGSRARLPRLRAPVGALSAIVGGQLSPVRAAEAGFVEDVRGAAETIEAWFRARAAFVYPFNAF